MGKGIKNIAKLVNDLEKLYQPYTANKVLPLFERNPTSQVEYEVYRSLILNWLVDWAIPRLNIKTKSGGIVMDRSVIFPSYYSANVGCIITLKIFMPEVTITEKIENTLNDSYIALQKCVRELFANYEVY